MGVGVGTSVGVGTGGTIGIGVDTDARVVTACAIRVGLGTSVGVGTGGAIGIGVDTSAKLTPWGSGSWGSESNKPKNMPAPTAPAKAATTRTHPTAFRKH